MTPSKLSQSCPTVHRVLMEGLPRMFAAHEKQARAINAVFELRLQGQGGGSFTLDLRKLTVGVGSPKKADVVLELPTQDFLSLLQGRLDVGRATQEKRIHVSGNRELVVSLAQLLGA